MQQARIGWQPQNRDWEQEGSQAQRRSHSKLGAPACRQTEPFMHACCEETVIYIHSHCMTATARATYWRWWHSRVLHAVSLVGHAFSIRVRNFIYLPAFRWCLTLCFNFWKGERIANKSVRTYCCSCPMFAPATIACERGPTPWKKGTL